MKPKPEHIDMLMKNPDLAHKFDEIYGKVDHDHAGVPVRTSFTAGAGMVGIWVGELRGDLMQ